MKVPGGPWLLYESRGDAPRTSYYARIQRKKQAFWRAVY